MTDERRKYRTTCFADAPAHYDRSIEDSATWKEDVIGIRLARDSGVRFQRIDEGDDDCRLARGGGHYMQRPHLKGGFNANCLVHEYRMQFGLRLVHDVIAVGREGENP